MKKGGGKNKGNEYERELSKKLSLFFTGLEDASKMWRSQSSGGRATTFYKKGLDLSFQEADIVGLSGLPKLLTDYYYVIEAKRYKEFQLLPLFKPNTKPPELIKEFIKTVQIAKRTDKIALFIFRPNFYTEDLILTTDWSRLVPLKIILTYNGSNYLLTTLTEYLFSVFKDTENIHLPCNGPEFILDEVSKHKLQYSIKHYNVIRVSKKACNGKSTKKTKKK